VSDLILDLQRLDQLHSDLQAVIAEFKDASEFSHDVADATGDDHLADKVRDFADRWNDKRKNMTESVENLQKAIAAITDNFSKVDQGLAKALEDSENKKP
jgi:chaperonin cofactor prefoldin